MDPSGLVGYDDYIGIRNQFVHFKYSMSDFFDKLLEYITFQGKERNLYSVFLNAFTRIFSSNYHFFFAVASVPYLVFSLATVRKMVNAPEYPKYGVYALLMILLLVIPRDIVTVQNPRYTTAVWLSMWGFLNYFDESKARRLFYILPILMAPFIHSGFYPMVMVFLVAAFMPIQINKIEYLFYISIPFSFFSYDLFESLNYSFLPPFLSDWIQTYLNDDTYDKWVLHKGASGFFWVTQLFSYIRYAAYFLIPFMLMKHRDQILANPQVGKLYPFYILLFAVTNFIRMLPTIGERYLFSVQIMSVYMFFKVFYPLKRKYFGLLLFSWSFPIFIRWFYSGAGLYLVPKNIYYDNLFSLIADYIQQ